MTIVEGYKDCMSIEISICRAKWWS